MPYRKLTSKFNAAISQVEDLLTVNAYLETEVPVKSVSDHLLRASLTMTVSAMDTLIHELVINAIVYELKKEKSVFTTKGIQVDISATREPDLQNRLRMIEASLRRQYSKQSFQSTRQIEGALASVGMKKIWKQLSVRLNQPAEDIKIKLDLMVRRRNQIVHEGDLDQLHNLQCINRDDVKNSYVFLKQIAAALVEEFKDKIV